MINPAEVTKFDRSDAQLEEFLLFAIVVAGKNSKIQAGKLAEFLLETGISKPFGSPFEMVRQFHADNALRLHLERAKLGQYNRLAKVFVNVVNMPWSLRDVTVEQLQLVVGLKTARFFLMHSRQNVMVAALDTHILAHMRENLGIPTPKSTPTNPSKYLELEQLFLTAVDKSGKSLADYDLEVWKSRRIA